MEAVDLIHEQLSDCSSSERVMERKKMPILSEGIHYHQNAVGRSRCWQTLNKVQGYNFPSMRWHL
jgi:hypothetical protein